MDKAYEPKIHDQKWQKFWDERNFAKPEVSYKLHPKPTGRTFTIMMPPPNVTGVLHQGHALMLALEDTLIRWHRMLGDETLYVPGTDHASIAVNMQVVKHLATQGIDHKKLGREEFLKECWAWIEEYRPRIFNQIRMTGTSCDWSRVKFTMDPDLNKAVVSTFVELHKRGLIYRAEKLVNWSPKGQTGLSDLEVIFEEREGSLWHVRYPVVGEKNAFITVATTRPETLLGDTAVAVHPDDKRYTKLVGKKIRLPFVDREIPILADTFVDSSFGSGAVKITPAHDHNDFEVGERHKLEKLNILTKEGTIVSGLRGEAASFGGLDRFEARKKMVARLEEMGLLEKVEKHKNRVGLSERWNDVVEPFLSHQWYLKMDQMAARAAGSVTGGDVEIVPGEFKNQFMRWMESIHDWCVSRQLWWGQQIPAYHCESCAHIEVAETAPESCSQCKSAKILQDPDVLDTWFSSALWPFSTLGWPDSKASDYKKFYPTNVMETGFDILFFWVARMLMMGLELTGKAPFSKVYLHPMVRDEHGQKMSKTKGNVKDPLDIMQEYGTDTLRFTFNALCVQGRDLRLSEERIETYKHFINKVWNAAKFALMPGGVEINDASWKQRPAKPLHLHDRWILARLDATARDVNAAWSNFRMQEGAETLYHFVWNDVCDWYLESVKSTRDESRPVLLFVLGETLKLLHPICPHVTEEIYHALPGVGVEESLSISCYPEGQGFPDASALAEFSFLQNFVSALRTLRAEAKVPPGKKFRVFVTRSRELENSLNVLERNAALVALLVKLEALVFEAVPGTSPTTRVVVTAIEAGKNVEAYVPVAELVDLDEERSRLKKEIESLTKIVTSQAQKLSNESFVSRAPKEVIDKEKIKLAEAKDKLQKTEQTLASFGAGGIS